MRRPRPTGIPLRLVLVAIFAASCSARAPQVLEQCATDPEAASGRPVQMIGPAGGATGRLPPAAATGGEPAGEPPVVLDREPKKAPEAPSAGPGSDAEPAKPSSGDEKVDAALDRLEAKGRAIKGLYCRLIYSDVVVWPVEDRKIKEGYLWFTRGEPDKFLIHFDKKIASGAVSRDQEFYLFDGRWLSERNDKAKTFINREIAREGERVDPFELGKGPFPLPFGQKREEILRHFEVAMKEYQIGDPPQSVHLHCVPKPGTRLAEKYRRVALYVDMRLDLPVRIVCERVSDDNRIEVDFKDIDVGAAPAQSRFQIEVPRDFEQRVEPLPPPDIQRIPPLGEPAAKP